MLCGKIVRLNSSEVNGYITLLPICAQTLGMLLKFLALAERSPRGNNNSVKTLFL